MRTRLIACSAIFFALISSAHAEPDPIVRWLMNKPVSLFSFGLFRTETFLNERLRDQNLILGVSYKWERNRIEIVALDLTPRAEPQDRCQILIDEIRKNLGINPGTGQPYSENTLIDGFLLPIGYSHTDGPNTEETHIAAITSLVVSTIHERDRKRITCHGDLLSNEAYYF